MIESVLIANRGEIAIRIAQAVADLGLRSVSIYSEDDAESLHVRAADQAVRLGRSGPSAYLDFDAIAAAAKSAGCDAVHTGYGFLAESAAFARTTFEAGLVFIGPAVEHLELFGDKARAREAAQAAGVPVPRGFNRAVTLAEAQEFFDSLGGSTGMMIKAGAGGGGRGTRAVTYRNEIEAAFDRCRSEAARSFGNDALYVEEYITQARHIEVQVLGDSTGNVVHLGERECSVQRRYQKLIEIAPAPGLPKELRQAITSAAVPIAQRAGYRNVGTFEFLVDASGGGARFVFIEANARLQVEHTVTEEATAVDIVQAQLRLADGATVAELGLAGENLSRARGYAIQARVNMETIGKDGMPHPSSGTLANYQPPGGPGIRTDGFGYTGYRTNTSYDSLLAKVIAHIPTEDLPAVGGHRESRGAAARVRAPGRTRLRKRQGDQRLRRRRPR